MDVYLPHQVPGSYTTITDNTVRIPERPYRDPGVTMFTPLFSERGRSNKLIFKNNVDDYIEEFGRMDFKKYGQTGYNAHAHISQDLTSLLLLRLTADDAAFANNVIIANVKVKPFTPGDPLTNTDPIPGSMTVKLTTVTLPAVDDETEFELRLQEILEDGAIDTGDGIQIPLMYSYLAGPGSYGNSFRTRVTRNEIDTTSAEQILYTFQMMEMASTLTIPRTYTGALNSGSKFYGESSYINDVLEQATIDEDVTNEPVLMYTKAFETGFSQLYDIYSKQVRPTVLPDAAGFDPLFGLDIDRQPLEGYEVIEVDEETVNLEAPDGVALSSGSDGALDTSDISPEAEQERERVREDLLIRAFKGEIDRQILSTRRTKVQFALDANFPDTVKDQMRQWQLQRNSEMLFLDAGLIENKTDALEFSNKHYDKSSDHTYGISANAWMYEIQDPFSGKRVPVTSTHFVASKLASWFNNNDEGGNFRAWAASTAQVTGHVPHSVRPAMDSSLDITAMSYLIDRRTNYVEFMSSNKYQRGTQTTSLTDANKRRFKSVSDLGEENNVHVLYEAKKILEEMNDEQVYKHSTPEDRDAFAQHGKRVLEQTIGHKAHSYDISYGRNAKTGVVYCLVWVVFKPMSKQFHIALDVNPYIEEGGNQ